MEMQLIQDLKLGPRLGKPFDSESDVDDHMLTLHESHAKGAAAVSSVKSFANITQVRLLLLYLILCSLNC